MSIFYKNETFSHSGFLFYYLIFDCAGSPLPCRLFSICGEWGLLLVAASRLLLAVASLVVEHGL